MKKLFLLLVFFMSSLAIFAQGIDDVKLVVSGEASTKSDAITIALRNAIEQAYGVFVSANTEILNDELVKDEIATVSSGNVKKYSELSCIMNADSSSYMVTLEAIVSLKKLTQYAESKGSSCEFAGALIEQNIKLLDLNRKNTMLAMEHLMTQLEQLVPSLYDYTIRVSTPSAISTRMDIMVDINYNSNVFTFYDIIRSTLKSLEAVGAPKGAKLWNFIFNDRIYHLYYPFPEERLERMLEYAQFNYQIYVNGSNEKSFLSSGESWDRLKKIWGIGELDDELTKYYEREVKNEYPYNFKTHFEIKFLQKRYERIQSVARGDAKKMTKLIVKLNSKLNKNLVLYRHSYSLKCSVEELSGITGFEVRRRTDTFK